MLIVVRCLLMAVCCCLFDVLFGCVLCVVSYVLSVGCGLLYVVFCLLSVHVSCFLFSVSSLVFLVS